MPSHIEIRGVDEPDLTGHFGMSRRDFVRSSLGAVAASAVLPACGNTSVTGTGGGDPRLSARPGSPTVEPTLGLSQLGLASGRDGVLYVPQSYSPDTPTPLFVALHGAGGDGEDWASYYTRAEDRGMVFLAPDSRSGTWDAIRGNFGADVGFLDRALRHTFERCRIDPARLALGGFSDGASYALSLGVSNGDLFSDLVAYSPGLFRPNDPIVGKPPIFISHGRSDRILPVGNSRDQIVPILLGNGYDVTYLEFEGGHEVPAEISDQALDWFLGTPS
jgi:phospholipase/carboxylesterase